MRDFGNGNFIYTKPSCGWCVKAKNLLKEKNLPFTELVLDGKNIDKHSMNQDLGRNDLSTIPQIVLNGKFVPGGFTGLVRHFGDKK